MLHIAAAELATNADQAIAETNSKSLQRDVLEIRLTDLMRLASTLAISTLPFVLDILGLPFALLLLLAVFKGYYQAHNYDNRNAGDFFNNGIVNAHVYPSFPEGLASNPEVSNPLQCPPGPVGRFGPSSGLGPGIGNWFGFGGACGGFGGRR